MGGMLMSDKLVIRSKLKDYVVEFIDDFTVTIDNLLREDSFLIIDKKVAELYSKGRKSLYLQKRVLVVEATELNKTLDYCSNIIEKLLANNIRRNSTLVAIGGGVVQDIAAFVSSILFRGIDWTFFPTTLLAQADSCIGGKSSINFGNYKNLLGGFYPPLQIFIDTGFLETLPAEEIKSGIGEMLHYYLIADNGLYLKLMDEYENVIASPLFLKEYILESLTIKKNVIEVDEFDKGIRNLFNYGHTFGHAIETVSGYQINHGQAVTMGMDLANYISWKSGYIDEQIYQSMKQILSRNMPAFTLTKNNIGNYLNALSKDKKNIDNNLGCILTKGPGHMFKIQIPMDKSLKKMILSYNSSSS
jgi:3-dehydroquinate synthase